MVVGPLCSDVPDAGALRCINYGSFLSLVGALSQRLLTLVCRTFHATGVEAEPA
jgi:hypothetical protein